MADRGFEVRIDPAVRAAGPDYVALVLLDRWPNCRLDRLERRLT